MDPATGTFMSMDTYGCSLSDPMSLHKYLFANANPVKHCDPSGNMTLTETGSSMLLGAVLAGASYSIMYFASLLVDHVRGTNYSANYSLGGLFLTMIYGALLSGLGLAFSIGFQALHLTCLQYVGLSVFCILIGLDLKACSYFTGKSGDVIWSAILGPLGDASLVAGGSAIGAGINAKNSPLGLKNFRVNNDSGQAVCRSMKNDNGVPQTGESARTLGVRPGTGDKVDIAVSDDGMVKHGEGGMSVVPDPNNLSDFKKPPSLGGKCKDPVWVINTDCLGPKLVYKPDLPVNATHGTIQPKYTMPYNEYVEALEATQSYWRLIIDG